MGYTSVNHRVQLNLLDHKLPELPVNLIYWHLWCLNLRSVHQQILLQRPTRIPIRFSWLQHNFSPQTELLIRERQSQQLFRYVHSHTVDNYHSYGNLFKFRPNDQSSEPFTNQIFDYDLEDNGLAITESVHLEDNLVLLEPDESMSSYYWEFIQILNPGYTCQSPEFYRQLPWKAINFVVEQKITVYHDYMDQGFCSVDLGDYSWYQDVSAFKQEDEDATLFHGEYTAIKESDYHAWLNYSPKE